MKIFNLRLAPFLAFTCSVIFGLYLLLMVYGSSLQDHRSPEVQSLTRLNGYLGDIGISERALLNGCKRAPADVNEERLGINFFVNCSAENIPGHGRIILSAAFGSRDQIEFLEISEVPQ